MGFVLDPCTPVFVVVAAQALHTEETRREFRPISSASSSLASSWRTAGRFRITTSRKRPGVGFKACFLRVHVVMFWVSRRGKQQVWLLGEVPTSCEESTLHLVLRLR